MNYHNCLFFGISVSPHSFLNSFGYCIQGFRKIDTDRWEFANEGFLRGKRHLLKNIQRRKSPQSQQLLSYVGPSTEPGRSGMEDEIGKLKKEKTLLLQEVSELQEQQRKTVHHMEVVNQKLQGAELTQKQTVSFLAKLLQSPSFLAHLQQKEQMNIESPKMRRKFVRHHQNDQSTSQSSMEGQMVKFSPNLVNVSTSSVIPASNPLPVETFPDRLLQDMVGKFGLSAEAPFPGKRVASEDLAVSDELAAAHRFINTPEQAGEGFLSMEAHNPSIKGKSMVSPQQEVSPGYCEPFPDDLTMENNLLEFTSPGIENISKQEDIWSMGFDAVPCMSSSRHELLGNAINYDVPELGVTGGFSDVWDLGQAAGGSGIDKWQAEETTFDELVSQIGQTKDISKNIDP